MNALVCTLAAALFALVCSALAQPLPQYERETFNCSADGSRWPFLVQTVPDPQAVLIYLHGHYSDETQGMTEGIYNDGFGKVRRECMARQWLYVCPWYGGNTWMGPLGEQGLADLIGILRQRWPGRPVYLCGGSMGGSSTLVFATRRPDLIDGAIARCPAGDIEGYYRFAAAAEGNATLKNIADAIRIHYTAEGCVLDDELRACSVALNAECLTMPIHVIHGAKDTVIPVEGTRRLVARLQELGRPVKYVELPEGGHDSPVNEVDWNEAFDFVAASERP